MPDHRALLAELIAAFPRDRITADTANVYLSKLGDVSEPLLAAVVHDLICTSERFPTIRAIREAAAERTLALPSDAAALAQVLERARGPAIVHPAVRETLTLVGGLAAFRVSENPDVFRGQFLRLWREQRARLVRDAQTGSFRELSSGRPDAAVSC